MDRYGFVSSPLDQFEIRNLIGLQAPILANLQVSLTNIGFYLIISLIISLMITLLTENREKFLMNKWSLNQESITITVKNLVLNQISASNGQIYFPFIYSLFIFILINNLLGMVQIGCPYYILSLFIHKQHQKFNFYTDSQFSTIHPYYITGFEDGEGYFSISIWEDKKNKLGWSVQPEFGIAFHRKDIVLLEKKNIFW